MGLQLWPDSEEHACNVATAVTVPDGVDDEQLRRRMIEKFGVLISGSLFNTPIYGKLMRLGHMGRTCSPAYGVVALTALGHCLNEVGCRADVGAGIDAFLSQLDPV
jgi:aspartate aminotransferase-like enzyme